jgi:AcrR family transcriptional regulator
MPAATLRVLDEGNENAAPVRMGRPPRVNLQLIVDAALELGLDGVSLPAVAAHLGVGTSTLYRHVRNRDELVRLAAARVALGRQLPSKRNGGWVDFCTRYAESLFDSLSREPLVIQELMRGRLGPDIEVDYLEPFLATLVDHGFTPVEGTRLFRTIGMLVVGAAVSSAAAAARGGAAGEREAFREAVAERPAHSLPYTRAAMEHASEFETADWRLLLNHMLVAVAAQRGETIKP